MRATGSLRLLEQALEEQGLPTYVVGGRGYWSQEQVRDGIAYLSALANPQDEEALLAVLASPFCGVGTDALVLLTQAGREGGRGAWAALRDAEPDGWMRHLPEAERARLEAFARFFAAERPRAERAPAEALLERAVVATGYDLAILARSGGDRRLANLRKLMRLARDYERAEGADLRGFLTYAVTQDLAEAREGEAALESDGLDAVRLMTIHRAKGLEFPVVCVADLGRAAATRPRSPARRPGGEVGLRLAPIGGGDAIPALAWERLAEEAKQAEDEEERRLFYVAMTRARERLILSGGVDRERLPAPRPGGPPIDWILRARGRRGPAGGDRGRARRRTAAVPRQRPRHARDRAAARRAQPGRTAPRGRACNRAPRRARRPARGPGTAAARPPAALLQRARRLRPLRLPLYLERVLGLPRVPPPAAAEVPGVGRARAPEGSTRWSAARSSIACSRSSTSPGPPRPRSTRSRSSPRRGDWSRPARSSRTFARSSPPSSTSSLCARLARARRTRSEAPFSFTLDVAGGGPLVTGFLDVVATEPDGGVLIVDYKSDRLEGAAPVDVVERDYATQRTVYALAALRDGAPTVEVAYCFLERPAEPVVATFTDAPALAEHLAGLAAGLLDGRYPVTATPHRDLCGDCPGRSAMCSWPRPPRFSRRPPPWAAAPGRRSRPVGAGRGAGPPSR